jgi:cellulose synthase/poly-beta-1,6-N-acetylglucosamine synthase-like glycosyltransferase
MRIRTLLLLAQLPAAIMVLYLDVLSVAAILWRKSPPRTDRLHRFTVLVPAHNEEALLPRLLDSIQALDYPPGLYEVHVVADNCTDSTAELALRGGATVHERVDPTRRGKGYALQWLLREVEAVICDAYVVLDADAIVQANFLTILNRHLARGDVAIQAYYGVSNAGDSWSAGLRYIGLALYNGLRPRGRDALGLSAGLHGNGMCFSRGLLSRFGWEAFTLAEDVEFHLRLVAAGIRVRYAGDTAVLADMPVSLAQAHTQNVRWERGRLQMIRRLGPNLMHEALLAHDPQRAAALVDQLIPPFSVLTGITVLGAALSLPFRHSAARRLGAAAVIGQTAYVLTGLRLARADRRVYALLLRAPLYMAWKIWVYLLAAVHLDEDSWVRTSRGGG